MKICHFFNLHCNIFFLLWMAYYLHFCFTKKKKIRVWEGSKLWLFIFGLFYLFIFCVCLLCSLLSFLVWVIRKIFGDYSWDLFSHSQQVVVAIRAGVNPSGHPSNESSIWDLSSSFFFAGTVITTIGNGCTQYQSPNWFFNWLVTFWTSLSLHLGDESNLGKGAW